MRWSQGDDGKVWTAAAEWAAKGEGDDVGQVREPSGQGADGSCPCGAENRATVLR